MQDMRGSRHTHTNVLLKTSIFSPVSLYHLLLLLILLQLLVCLFFQLYVRSETDPIKKVGFKQKGGLIFQSAHVI